MVDDGAVPEWLWPPRKTVNSLSEITCASEVMS